MNVTVLDVVIQSMQKLNGKVVDHRTQSELIIVMRTAHEPKNSENARDGADDEQKLPVYPCLA